MYRGTKREQRVLVQDAWLNSPWRAEPLYELAKWHDQQLRNCTPGNVECENKHHMGAFLNAKMVRFCLYMHCASGLWSCQMNLHLRWWWQ